MVAAAAAAAAAVVVVEAVGAAATTMMAPFFVRSLTMTRSSERPLTATTGRPLAPW